MNTHSSSGKLAVVTHVAEALKTDDAAGKEYAEAVRLEPDFAEAHLNWGIALLKQQSNAAARAHFQEARRLNPMDDITAGYLRALESQTNR